MHHHLRGLSRDYHSQRHAPHQTQAIPVPDDRTYPPQQMNHGVPMYAYGQHPPVGSPSFGYPMYAPLPTTEMPYYPLPFAEPVIRNRSIYSFRYNPVLVNTPAILESIQSAISNGASYVQLCGGNNSDSLQSRIPNARRIAPLALLYKLSFTVFTNFTEQLQAHTNNTGLAMMVSRLWRFALETAFPVAEDSLVAHYRTNRGSDIKSLVSQRDALIADIARIEQEQRQVDLMRSRKDPKLVAFEQSMETFRQRLSDIQSTDIPQLLRRRAKAEALERKCNETTMLPSPQLFEDNGQKRMMYGVAPNVFNLENIAVDVNWEKFVPHLSIPRPCD
jgi:hypothetical protein